MTVGFGILGSGFMAHTYAECLAKHVPDAHLVAVAVRLAGAGARGRVRRARPSPRPRPCWPAPMWTR